MKSHHFTALAVGLLLLAAEFLAMDHDARHGVPHYRGDVVTALPAHR